MVKEAYKDAYGLPWEEDDLAIPERYVDAKGENAVAFPGSQMPVVTIEKPDVIQAYEFGFIPHWADPEKLKEIRNTFNARIETISQLATWRDAWKNAQRCLVCTTGFFEHNKREKRQMFIHLKKTEYFYYAGIYNDYVNKQTGEVRRTMAVITTVPNELIAQIHNRMPVIIVPGTENKWMDISSNPVQLLSEYKVPINASAMQMDYADGKPKKPEQGKLF